MKTIKVSKTKELLARHNRIMDCYRTGWSTQYMGYLDTPFFDKNMGVQVTSANLTHYWFVVIPVKTLHHPTCDCVCIVYGHPCYDICNRIHVICKLTDIWAD